MIRQGKVHAICCTGANLEEDIFNLVAHDHYERVPNYRDLTPADEQALLERHMNRVTDTCIPEEEAMRRIEKAVLEDWMACDEKGERLLPARVHVSRAQQRQAEVRSTRSIRRTPGWSPPPSATCRCSSRAGRTPRSATCTPGTCITGDVKNVHTVRTGIEYMMELADWYTETSAQAARSASSRSAAASPATSRSASCRCCTRTCSAPNVPLWGYFCQISDSTTSYGSYSGAVPNEKITWGKLGVDTPKYIIESDATIVAPLIFAKVLGW